MVGTNFNIERGFACIWIKYIQSLSQNWWTVITISLGRQRWGQHKFLIQSIFYGYEIVIEENKAIQNYGAKAGVYCSPHYCKKDETGEVKSKLVEEMNLRLWPWSVWIPKWRMLKVWEILISKDSQSLSVWNSNQRTSRVEQRRWWKNLVWELGWC